MVTTTKAIGINPNTPLPDLFARHPHVREVFDQYGLHGCGGRQGPRESIRFFARTHGVDEQTLMQEIILAAGDRCRTTLQIAGDDQPPQAQAIEDTIYRRFFIAAIVVALTLGATWGAWLLWKIGFAGTFTGVTIHEVNAHGEAQIFGWVGLFIMGFSYQALPRMWHTRLAWPRLAVITFCMMTVGITIRTIGVAMAGADGALVAAMSGGVLQILASITFVTQMLATFRRSGATVEPYVGFVIAALLFFLAQAVMSVWHSWTTMSAASRDQLLWYVATYQAPLRDLQIHGLALLMILGVNVRLLPALYDVPKIGDRRAWWALGLLLLAVVGEAAVFVVYRHTEVHWVAWLLVLTWVLLSVGVLMIAWPWRLWRTLRDDEGHVDRSAKFIRAAYLWLGISLIMLLLLPAYQRLSGIPFSHAYYGAIRHAITVGFISLMILGFASKVVPTLNGVDPRGLSALYGPFVLINAGCLLRVSTQTLTDLSPLFFPIVGMSGLLEVSGIAWWGIGLIRIMRQGKRESTATASSPPPPPIISGSHRVADVLACYPSAEAIFLQHGFHAIRNPFLRRTLARQVTIAQAAKLRGVPIAPLLRQLNDPSVLICSAGRSASC